MYVCMYTYIPYTLQASEYIIDMVFKAKVLDIQRDKYTYVSIYIYTHTDVVLHGF